MPKLRALDPDLFLLPLLPGPLAAALPLATRLRLVWVAASSVCSPVARCKALRKCTTRALGPRHHWSPTATYAARHGAALGRTNVFPAACSSQPHRAARRPRAPPRARPREFLPLGRRPPCRAGVLRWRTTRVAARPPRGSSLAGTSHARGNPPQASLLCRRRRARSPKPFFLIFLIIGQPQGQRLTDSDGQALQPALCRREPCSQHETHKGNRVKRRTLPCGMVATAAG